MNIESHRSGEGRASPAPPAERKDEDERRYYGFLDVVEDGSNLSEAAPLSSSAIEPQSAAEFQTIWRNRDRFPIHAEGIGPLFYAAAARGALTIQDLTKNQHELARIFEAALETDETDLCLLAKSAGKILQIINLTDDGAFVGSGHLNLAAVLTRCISNMTHHFGSRALIDSIVSGAVKLGVKNPAFYGSLLRQLTVIPSDETHHSNDFQSTADRVPKQAVTRDCIREILFMSAEHNWKDPDPWLRCRIIETFALLRPNHPTIVAYLNKLAEPILSDIIDFALQGNSSAITTLSLMDEVGIDIPSEVLSDFEAQSPTFIRAADGRAAIDATRLLARHGRIVDYSLLVRIRDGYNGPVSEQLKLLEWIRSDENVRLQFSGRHKIFLMQGLAARIIDGDPANQGWQNPQMIKVLQEFSRHRFYHPLAVSMLVDQLDSRNRTLTKEELVECAYSLALLGQLPDMVGRLIERLQGVRGELTFRKNIEAAYSCAVAEMHDEAHLFISHANYRFRRGDTEELEQVAHLAKSACMAIGLPALSEVDDACKAKFRLPVIAVQEHLKRIQTELAALSPQFRDRCGGSITSVIGYNASDGARRKLSVHLPHMLIKVKGHPNGTEDFAAFAQTTKHEVFYIDGSELFTLNGTSQLRHRFLRSQGFETITLPTAIERPNKRMLAKILGIENVMT